MKRSAGESQKSSDERRPTRGPATRRASARRFAVVGTAVLAVFFVAGLVGAGVRDHKLKQLAAPSSAAGPSALAVPLWAHAPVTLTVYEDMRDPASAAFAQTYDATLARLINSGTVNVLYREVAGEDAAQRGSGSLNAGNALGCAQDAKLFAQYRTVLLANQPALSDDAFGSKARLISLAGRVSGLDTDVFRTCVQAGQHDVWVKDSTKDFTAAQLGGTPVLQMQVSGQDQPQTLIGGSTTLSPQDLVGQVIAVAQNMPAATATGSPVPSPSAS